MHTLLVIVLIWVTPGFLFVGWRLWMSRPLRDVHYRERWQYSHALVHGRTPQALHMLDR
jgi:hypothetical protein